MTASLYDSPAWRGVFQDPDLSPLFTDTAELRATLLVMGTLALTQAKAGVVPDVSAQAIQRASMEVQIDPAALSQMIRETGDPVLAIIAQFKSEMQAPEHAKWIHHDSDTALTAATALSLRLRQALKHIGARLSLDADTIPTAQLSAFHAVPAMQTGLAQGLGLADGTAKTPHAMICTLAAWATETAQQIDGATRAGTAIKHQMPLLNTMIQTAPNDATSLIASMTLPQMMLGLATLSSPRT